MHGRMDGNTDGSSPSRLSLDVPAGEQDTALCDGFGIVWTVNSLEAVGAKPSSLAPRSASLSGLSSIGSGDRHRAGGGEGERPSRGAAHGAGELGCGDGEGEGGGLGSGDGHWEGERGGLGSGDGH